MVEISGSKAERSGLIAIVQKQNENNNSPNIKWGEFDSAEGLHYNALSN